MKQLEAPRGTRIIRKILFRSLCSGFFKKNCDGRVFYACEDGGKIKVFPVLADRSILRAQVSENDLPHRNEEIVLIHPLALGIREIEWAEKSA